MSEPTSPRDELVTLLETQDEHGARRGVYDSTCRTCVKVRKQAAHLADVLIAAGWSKGDRLPWHADGWDANRAAFDLGDKP